MNTTRFASCIVILCLFIFSSCNSNEIGSSTDVNPQAIYFDYRVSGEEGDKDVTVMLQYRFGGAHGTTLVLEGDSKVELDGKLIKADSSKMTGAFYEIQAELNSFIGNHSIVFTDNNKKEYKETFRFSPVRLIAPLPATLKKEDLLLELSGLDPVDYVRVLLTDTSRASEGVNRVDTVRNGKLLISRYDLENLVNGPVHLELIREDERNIRNGTREGGRLAISYALRKEFTLE